MMGDPRSLALLYLLRVVLDVFSKKLFHFFVAVGGGVADGCGELREDG